MGRVVEIGTSVYSVHDYISGVFCMGRVVEIGTLVFSVHDYTSGVFCMGRTRDASPSTLSLLVQGSDRPRDHTADTPQRC